MNVVILGFVAIDIVVAAIALIFFVVGLGDGTVSSFNVLLWTGLLAALAGIVFGSLFLRRRGLRLAAASLAGILAVPTIVVAGGLLMLTLSGARWN